MLALSQSIPDLTAYHKLLSSPAHASRLTYIYATGTITCHYPKKNTKVTMIDLRDFIQISFTPFPATIAHYSLNDGMLVPARDTM